MALTNARESGAGRAPAEDSLSAVAVLIPARRFEAGLGALVGAVSAAGFGAVVVVDDGMSSEERRELEGLAGIPRVHLLHHAVNLGKGRALKTGINYFLTELTGFTHLVTADADGQHTPEDMVRVALAGRKSPGAVVLGCRRFGRDVPLRSRFGNTLTRLVFSFLSGREVSDTQTGLRGFPAGLLAEIVALPGERYEYEMTVLAHLSRRGVEVVETPIATIYIDDNRSSHFNPIRDSMRIYFVLVRFYASSLVSAGLDLAFFTITFWATRDLLLSVIVGRVSSLVNFALNRTLVFRSRGSIPGALWRYYALAVVLAGISYGGIRVFSLALGWNIVAIKILVETTLSLLSFSVQRTFVFAQGES